MNPNCFEAPIRFKKDLVVGLVSPITVSYTHLASDALFATGLLSTGAVWFVFALLLLSIWFGEPLLSMMGLAPAEHGHKTSVGMMILEGFFELFEAFLSWLSNCLSFLRVGTYRCV